MAGAGRYITGLASGLTRIPHEHEVFFLCNKHNAVLLPGKAIDCGILTQFRPSRILWEQTVLPYLLQQMRIDVYHGPVHVVPEIRTCPSVVTVHDMTWFTHAEYHTYDRRLLTKLIPRSVKRSSAVLAISNTTKSEIIRLLGTDPVKISVTHMGVDTTVFRPISDRSMLRNVLRKYGVFDRGYILYVGNVASRKNLPALVEAYADVRSEIGQRKLVICGAKEGNAEDVFDAVKHLDLGDDVVFTGYVEDADLPALYNGADLFVLPSKCEGFGIPLLEAMACGIPVIANKCLSMPEVVGDAGILVNCGDVSTLARAIRDTMEDESLRHSLRESGLERAREFTWPNTARSTLEVYEQVADTEGA